MTDKQYLISLSILLLIPIGATIYFYLWNLKVVRETEKIYGANDNKSIRRQLRRSVQGSVTTIIKNKISH